jgi:hypothetical protein
MMSDIGVLEEDFLFEWASQSLAIPKKNGTIRFVTDFRKLNLLLKRKMLPVSYSKDWGSRHDPFNGKGFFALAVSASNLMLGLKSYVRLYLWFVWIWWVSACTHNDRFSNLYKLV